MSSSLTSVIRKLDNKIELDVVASQSTRIAQDYFSETESKHLADFLSFFLSYVSKASQSESVNAFESIKDSFVAFTNFKTKLASGDFLAVPAKYLMQILIALSFTAESEKGRKNNRVMEDTGEALLSYFSKNQQSDEKSEMVFCVTSMIRLHFKRQTYRNCLSLVKWTETNRDLFKKCPKSELVTYDYYFGRLQLMEGNFDKAREILEEAYKVCKDTAILQRKRILQQLVPLKMLLGQTPSQQLLERFGLEALWTVVDAFNKGNKSEFEDKVDLLTFDFIKQGTLEVWVKLRCYVTRNLLRRIHGVMNENGNENGHILETKVFYNALNSLDTNGVSFDECEFMLQELINRKFVAGYYNSEKQALVFSKKNAFPGLDEVEI